jgi:hypothetical protein
MVHSTIKNQDEEITDLKSEKQEEEGKKSSSLSES